MLIWICALHCEAKPVIDFYRLKKSHEDNAFDLYRNAEMVCIVSGTGKLASAAASAWVAAREAPAVPPAWINLGSAGAARHALGSIFLLHQVIDADSGQRFYPVILERSGMPGQRGLCLSRASTDYRENYLFDMESSGFMQAALRFSSAEQIRCIKVVSDNRRVQTGRDRQAVSDLIGQNIEAIDRQAQSLLALNRQLTSLRIPADTWEAVTALAHFSETQRNRLRVLLRYLLSRNHDAPALIERLRPMNSAGAMIHSLQTLSQRDSERL